jgi:hypothetical protein
MAKLDALESIYAIDLLTRLTESIEGYLEDDRSGTEIMEKEIKEAKRLYRKFYKRMQKEQTQPA